MTRILLSVVVLVVAQGCSSIGQMTVKPYTAKTGEKVYAGQAKPKSDYNCSSAGDQGMDYWRKDSMLPGSEIESLTRTGVDTAPSRKANYVYVDMPSSVGSGAISFKTSAPTLRYFACANLPQ